MKKSIENSLARHPHFEPWQDPVSGVVSYLLNERVAPVQQSFYFTNSSVSADERWLWFHAAFPPNHQKTLACVSLDPDRPMIKHFPNAGFSCDSPMVAPEGNAAYFAMGNSIYKLEMDGSTRLICAVPKEFLANRQFSRIVMHLTMSADGKYFLLDGDVGNVFWVGIGDIETGEVTILREFANHHDHAQFSPTDPDLFLIPQDWWRDKTTGKHFKLDHRLWVMNVSQTRFEPVCAGDWYDKNSNSSHEWWSKDGLICWNDYDLGTFECDPYTLERTHVWKRALCHAHCDASRSYWCADESPYRWATEPVKILFYDRARDRETEIVSAMPQAPLPRDPYHLDPHPQFSPKGTWVTYTSMVRGQVDVALCPSQVLKDCK